MVFIKKVAEKERPDQSLALLMENWSINMPKLVPKMFGFLHNLLIMVFTKKHADKEKMDQSLALLMESWSISTLDMLK
jgi:hypothetical protein